MYEFTLRSLYNIYGCTEFFSNVINELGKNRADGTKIPLAWIYERFGLESALDAVAVLPIRNRRAVRKLTLDLIHPAIEMAEDKKLLKAVEILRMAAEGNANGGHISKANALAYKVFCEFFFHHYSAVRAVALAVKLAASGKPSDVKEIANLVLEAVELADGEEKRQQAERYQEEAFLRWLES